MQKKRILLIGGAGTLGSDILEANLTAYDFFVIDNFSESALTEDELAERVLYKNISVANKNDLFEVFQEFRPQIVLYLSTTLSNNQLRAYESNVLGLANTIEAAEQIDKPYLIYIQSFLTRNCDSLITTNSPIEAKDCYATWKLAAEYLLRTYSGRHTTLILASVLSPRLSVGAIPAFINRIQNKQVVKVTDTLRDYITSEIFISALSALFENNSNNTVEVLGSSQPINTMEILKITALALGKQMSNVDFEIVQPIHSDPKTISLDNSLKCSSDFDNNDIKSSIVNVVLNFLNSEKVVRKHH